MFISFINIYSDKSALKSKKQFQSDDELEEGNAKKLSKENIKKLLKGKNKINVFSFPLRKNILPFIKYI